MVRLALAALLGNRLRTLSTIVAVQLAVALVCVLRAMPAELGAFLDDLSSEARFSVTHRAGLTSRLPPEVARRIRTLPGVRDAVASTYFGGSSERDGRITFPSMAVEAMAADVPIMAYAAAAIPDTLGGAGVQLETKNLEYAAELLGFLAFDDDLRAKVIAGQRRRLADFGEARIVRELERILAS